MVLILKPSGKFLAQRRCKFLSCELEDWIESLLSDSGAYLQLHLNVNDVDIQVISTWSNVKRHNIGSVHWKKKKKRKKKEDIKGDILFPTSFNFFTSMYTHTRVKNQTRVKPNLIFCWTIQIKQFFEDEQRKISKSHVYNVHALPLFSACEPAQQILFLYMSQGERLLGS